MGKKKQGKSRDTKRSRRSLPPDARPSAPPRSGPIISDDEGARSSDAGSSAVVAAPPDAPDSLAPLSKPEESPAPAPAVEPAPPVAQAAPAEARESEPSKEAPPRESVAEVASSSNEAVADAKHPSSRKLALDDEHHDAFFSGAEAAVEKMHAEARIALELEAAAHRREVIVLTPELRERQQRLRKWVGGIVVVAAAASVLALLRTRDTTNTTALPAGVAAPAPSATMKPEPAAPTKPEPAAPTTSAPTTIPSAAPTTSTAAPDATPSASPPAASASAAADPAAAKELTKKALRALERSDFKAAIDLGSRAVDADPTDASPYLYWGTALMETGKRADAKAVFGKCVEAATRGPKHECRAFR